MQPTCPYCQRPFQIVAGCDPVMLPNAHLFGDEPHWAELERPERCRDCGARPGFAHHGDCLQAYCRTCDQQALMCPHGPEAVDD